MFKILLLSISTLLISSISIAQTTNLGGPISWKGKLEKSKTIPSYTMPSIDLEALIAEDAINDPLKDAPWRFGYKHDTQITLADGLWTDLPNGNRLWRVELECTGATTVNLIFENLYIPEGAHLYLSDVDQTNRVGAYTSRNNRKDGILGTELVHGEKIIVEYFEPYAVKGLGHLMIANVTHGYRAIIEHEDQYAKALNSSGDCNIDVNCPLGSGWENQIKSVAMIVVNGSGYCTGALINNTCNDGTPYFLTANHCVSNGVSNWAFRWNWKSPPGTESCATTVNSVDPGPPYDQTSNGATLLVSGTEADHALVLIDNMTEADAATWNLYYAGWNNEDTDGLITQATGVHHPSGDVMKICREDDSPYHNNSAGADVWYIDSWDQGVTEPGSSGSPLFDQNGRIIGQLYGGAAACSGTVNNGTYDYYGRLGVSWGLGIGDYLDPVACGGTAVTNNGYDPSGPTPPDNSSIQSIESPTGTYCDANFTPSITLQNAGSNALTSVTINYDVDGGTNQTFNWVGNLAQYATEQITLPAMTGTNGAHVFNVSTSMPNGVPDTDPSNDANLSNFTIVIGAYATTISISTDCYGYENYWELTDASSTIIAFGGNTTGIPPGGSQGASGGDAGSYPSETTIDEVLCLLEECYDFTIYDDWGDGMEGTASAGCNTDGSYSITSDTGYEYATLQNVDFGNSETINFCVGSAGIDESDLFGLSIYPNPSNGEINVSFNNEQNNDFTVYVTDLAGRVIYTSTVNSNMLSINLGSTANGTYMLHLANDYSQVTKKVVVQK